MNGCYYGGPCTQYPPDVSDEEEELEDCMPEMRDPAEPVPYPEDL